MPARGTGYATSLARRLSGANQNRKDTTMTIVRYNYPKTSLTPTVRGANPWSSFERELDRLFTSAVSDFAVFSKSGDLDHFPVDLYEDADNHFVRAELPGVERSEINVEMVEGYLTVSGKRAVPGANGDAAETLEFSRSLAIPEAVQADKVAATYENGVLTVTLPKREEAKPRKISIEVK
jgi:HSP20 family protein